MRTAAIIIAAYTMIGFLTYGYAVNHNWYALAPDRYYQVCRDQYGTDTPGEEECEDYHHGTYPKAMMSGAGWPFVLAWQVLKLAGSAAVFATRWP